MGTTTAINWCDHTYNPWRGCAHVSEGCRLCYAERWAKRNPAVFGTWGPDGERVIASETYWKMPLRWNRAAKLAGQRRRVFCGSMMDVFEDRPELVENRERLLISIARTPHLDWLLLTKRVENVDRLWREAAGGLECLHIENCDNVWLGVTVENQEAADNRIPALLRIPPAVRFLSVEPMLGPVDLSSLGHVPGELFSPLKGEWRTEPFAEGLRPGPVYESGCPHVNWIIVGGESGPGCRPCNLDWIRSVVDQCRAAGVPVWVKQLGGHPNKRERLEDLPEDLRIRELPIHAS